MCTKNFSNCRGYCRISFFVYVSSIVFFLCVVSFQFQNHDNILCHITVNVVYTRRIISLFLKQNYLPTEYRLNLYSFTRRLINFNDRLINNYYFLSHEISSLQSLAMCTINQYRTSVDRTMHAKLQKCTHTI